MPDPDNQVTLDGEGNIVGACVVDDSFSPSGAAVNPAMTVLANAVRVAKCLEAQPGV